jgi:hypothetical protein
MTVTAHPARPASADTRDRGTVAANLDEWLLPEGRELTTHVAAEAVKSPQLQSRSAEHHARLTKAARLVVAGEVVHQLRRALPDQLMDLLLQGMAEHTLLQTAARETVGVPESRAPVHLAEHTVHVQHAVDVDISSPVFRIVLPFVLEIDFTVVSADGMVTGGRLTELELADPQVVGRVRARDQVVYEEKGALHLGHKVSLDPGLRLLSEAEESRLREPTAT